jgi:C4-dicarboxylate-specific signal transduction histidine kinase
MEPVDINRAITEGLFFLENQALFHNIQIIKELGPSLPFALGNAGQLKQVFMNIIVNAAEAMHGNGTLTIISSFDQERKIIAIEFTDTGEGIPEENLSPWKQDRGEEQGRGGYDLYYFTRTVSRSTTHHRKQFRRDGCKYA